MSRYRRNVTQSTTAIIEPVQVPTVAIRYRRTHHYLNASLIGLFVGLLALAFRYALFSAERGRDALLVYLHVRAPHTGWVVMPLIGVLAGLLIGGMMRFSPEAAGSGIPHLKGVLLGVRQLDWKRLLPVKFIGGVIGIGTGLSLGREGPTVQMSAALGQIVARLRNVPPHAVPQLLSCGAGAGLAAAFNAPLAGFIFVIEELHRELSSRTMVGALIAAVVATAIAGLVSTQEPSFSIREYDMLPIWALPAAAALGALGGLLGVAFNLGLLSISMFSLDQKLVPRWILPAIVGALMGLIAWWMPYAIGGGHGPAEKLLGGQMSLGVTALLLWLAVKFIATVLSYGTGAPGGIFAPMLLLGAILGTAFGKLCGWVLPSLSTHAQAFAVLGMAAVFVGSVRAPLTGIVLISEMTANYQQLFALCVVCLAAQLVGEYLRAEPVYDSLLDADLHRRGVKPAAEAQTIYLGVQNGSPLSKVTLRDSQLPKGALVVTIERSGRSIVPGASTRLLPGDHISVSIPEDDPAIALRVAEQCLPDD